MPQLPNQVFIKINLVHSICNNMFASHMFELDPVAAESRVAV